MLKKKGDALKRIEDQLFDQLTNETEIGALIQESTDIELRIEESNLLIEELLSKHFPNTSNDEDKISSSKYVKDTNTVRLPKLEITKFTGESTVDNVH